jgi:N-acetylglucosamine-6-phosphate deacetylase
MSHMTGREPGVVGAAINSSAYVGIICDGIHVSDDMVGLALRARPDPDLSFLVSDAMPTVGGPLEFDLYGNTIRLHQNRLINDEGSLAGAHVTMAESVARLVRSVGVTPEAALRMAITVPSAVMGLNLGRISGCKSSDLLCLGAGLMFEGYLSDALAA